MTKRNGLIAACAIALMIAPSPSMAKSPKDPELLQQWVILNEGCRGGYGDNPATMRACDERNLVDAALFARGYCFVGNYGVEQRWEKGPASRWTRHGERAVCNRF